MAGIYFHIPFCKARCVYCDFFSSVGQRREEQQAYVDAMCRELRLRRSYLKGAPVRTLYFGGGTPSLLAVGLLERIFETWREVFPDAAPVEITLEANPDDLTGDYLDSLRALPFNRISLGVQSLNDAELRFLRRRHDAATALRAVDRCRERGFANISIDLIYGLPGQTVEGWQATLRQAIDLQVEHVSAYLLTCEEGTPLADLYRRLRCFPPDEDRSLALFEVLLDRLSEAGFEHYELSNFARPGYHSRHNSAYWDGSPYLGIGAAAHSFDGASRQWNAPLADATYLERGFEREVLDERARYNELVLTRLRTARGIDLEELEALFGAQKKACCLQQASKYIAGAWLRMEQNRLQLTRKGLFVSDGIATDLLL
jgi:oxygen-independent coproporphyrinogen-3 oxidase